MAKQNRLGPTQLFSDSGRGPQSRLNPLVFLKTFKKEESRRFEILGAHWDFSVEDVNLDD
jgi:hypothetical protein